VIPTKACPVVFQDATASRILVFRHPAAGIQLVKGSIEPDESPSDAALRELREEAGIANAAVRRDLGVWDAGFAGQIWSFQLCATACALPECWSHQCSDDGGIELYFFWHDIDADSSEEWHPLFRRALQCIRLRLRHSSP
jgi:8-oxo-dGTP pyrophosphatase MutT (NUDIX family)